MKRIKSLVTYTALVLCILLLLSGCGKKSSLKLENLAEGIQVHPVVMLDDSFLYFTYNVREEDLDGVKTLYRCYFEDGRQVSFGEVEMPYLALENPAIIQDTLYFVGDKREWWTGSECIRTMYAIDLSTNEFRLIYSDSEPKIQPYSRLHAINDQLCGIRTSRHDGSCDLEITLLDPATGQAEQTLGYTNDNFSATDFCSLDGYLYLGGISSDGRLQFLKLNRQLELETVIDLSAMEAELEDVDSFRFLGENLVLFHYDSTAFSPIKDLVAYLDGDRLIPMEELVRNAHYADCSGGYPLFYKTNYRVSEDSTFHLFRYNEETHMLDETVVPLDRKDDYRFSHLYVGENHVLFEFSRYHENSSPVQSDDTWDDWFYWTDRNFTGLSSLPPES